MSTIERIVYQPIDVEYEDDQVSFIRIPVTSVKLVEGHGLENDRKAGHHPDRQVNILSREWLDEVSKLGYFTGPGEFGEQLTVTGLDFSTLGLGTQLQLGDEAIVEIVKPRTGCSRLEAAQGKSIAGIGGIGLLARVISTGEIHVGDTVRVLETAAA